MYIKPADGLRVFDPVRKNFIPDEGMEVSDQDFYWARRLRDGDVVKTTAPTAQAPAAAAESTTKDAKK